MYHGWDDAGVGNIFEVVVQEMVGTFFFVFMYMHATHSTTQYSTDSTINCLIIASAFCAGRLLAGGCIMTKLGPKNKDEATLE